MQTKNATAHTLKSTLNQNWQLLIFLWNITVFIINYLSLLIIFLITFVPLIILNQNIFPSLLQHHLFSSLMTCLLAWGRGSLSLTWDPPIANHNHPINSPWTKSSPALHLFLFEKPFYSYIRHNREEKTIATFT